MLSDNFLFQDNESSIKMENNGRRSCTGNSRHVHIRYFFVKDLVYKKQMRVVYCPTLRMLADFFTKPLQGELYRFFRNIVMGYVSIVDLISGLSENKERVGKYNNKWEKYNKEVFSKYPEIGDKRSIGDVDSKDVRTCSKNTHDSTNPVIQQVQSGTKKNTYADVLKAGID